MTDQILVYLFMGLFTVLSLILVVLLYRVSARIEEVHTTITSLVDRLEGQKCEAQYIKGKAQGRLDLIEEQTVKKQSNPSIDL